MPYINEETTETVSLLKQGVKKIGVLKLVPGTSCN